MNIDGVNTLACTMAIEDTKKRVGINPLPHQPVVKDLVPDLTNFYAQHKKIKPWLKTKEKSSDTEFPQSKEDREKIINYKIFDEIEDNFKHIIKVQERAPYKLSLIHI